MEQKKRCKFSHTNALDAAYLIPNIYFILSVSTMYTILASSIQKLKKQAIFEIDKWRSECSLVKNLSTLYG